MHDVHELGEEMPSRQVIDAGRQMMADFSRFIANYQFAVEEVLTKVSVLRGEFLQMHQYNPIEHVSSRVKSAESVMAKVVRSGCEPTLQGIRASIRDIAGVRITCSFIADTYAMFDALTSQDDVRVLQVKDYIKTPKPSGYKSLHAIVEIPVFLSTGPVFVPVEIQFRTVAMDFWASLEHKLRYKHGGVVPDPMSDELHDIAEATANLDQRMATMHEDVMQRGDGAPHGPETVDEGVLRAFWASYRAAAS